MVLPGVVGFKLLGKLRDGVIATDLVLIVTQMLRKHGVVGSFLSFLFLYEIEFNLMKVVNVVLLLVGFV